MENKKDDAVKNYYDLISKSWTWEKLTKEEQKRFSNLLNDGRITKTIKGNYQQRWEVLESLYYSYLIALNYSWDKWRV